MEKMLYFRVEEIGGTYQIWYCKTEEHKNKILARLDKLGRGYTVTRVWK